ncbi:hypothetical protein [Plantibacter sp. MPB07]|uniref:hypothetical protein n=1 Tax=Plantibacter sp. MPB07 TaxID=3388853 RepID=UPI00398736AA
MTDETPPRDAASRKLRPWRVGLGVSGVAMLGFAAVVFLDEVRLDQYPGVAAWLIGALILHDGVIALAAVGLGMLLRLAGWRPITTAIVGGATVVGATMALIVIPAVVKDAIGTANPTVLPLDYLGNLLWFELGVVVVAVVMALVARAVSGRRR